MLRKIFRQMLISQIVSAMAVTLCLLVDSIMIGQFLGLKSLAAYGLANPVLLIFAAFGSMLSTGVQVTCSKAMANGNEEEINRLFSVSVTVVMVFSIVGLTLVLLFLDPLCVLLGAKNGSEIHELTKDYLRGFIIGAPAFLAAQVLVPYLQMSGERVRLVVAVLGMTVADIGFDFLNVYVIKQGTFGMGLASTVSYYMALIIGGAYFFKKRCAYKFRPKLIGLRGLKEIAEGGIPTVVNQISLVLLVFTINKVMMRVGGDVAVGAYSIVSTIANLGYCLGSGLSEVTLMLGSIYYSEEDEKTLNELVKVQSTYALLINMVATALFLVFTRFFVRFFLNSNPDAESAAIFGLRMFAISLIPSAVNAAFKKYYQAIGMIRFSESISVAQNFFFPAIVVLTMGKIMGEAGVWWYYLIGELLSLIYISIYVSIKSKKRIFSHVSYVCLPENFGLPPEDVLEISIVNFDQVTDAAIAAAEFCEKKGHSKKRCMYTSLCIEEMSNNIIQHGFVEGQDNRIDIRLTQKEHSLIVRIRDNCKGFDPVKFLEMSKKRNEDPTSHIGIRMTFKVVKNVQYVNSLGLNNLMLEI